MGDYEHNAILTWGEIKSVINACVELPLSAKHF